MFETKCYDTMMMLCFQLHSSIIWNAGVPVMHYSLWLTQYREPNCRLNRRLSSFKFISAQPIITLKNQFIPLIYPFYRLGSAQHINTFFSDSFQCVVVGGWSYLVNVEYIYVGGWSYLVNVVYIYVGGWSYLVNVVYIYVGGWNYLVNVVYIYVGGWSYLVNVVYIYVGGWSYIVNVVYIYVGGSLST